MGRMIENVTAVALLRTGVLRPGAEPVDCEGLALLLRRMHGRTSHAAELACSISLFAIALSRLRGLEFLLLDCLLSVWPCLVNQVWRCQNDSWFGYNHRKPEKQRARRLAGISTVGLS